MNLLINHGFILQCGTNLFITIDPNLQSAPLFKPNSFHAHHIHDTETNIRDADKQTSDADKSVSPFVPIAPYLYHLNI